MMSKESRHIGCTFTRILFSLVILKDLIVYFFNSKSLVGRNSICIDELYIDILEYYQISFLYLDFSSPIVNYSFWLVAIVSCTIFLFGYKILISGLILFFCLLEIRFKCLFLQDGADNVIYIILPFLMFCRSYNLMNGKLVNNFSKRFQVIPSLAVMGIIIELCLIYFFGGLSKLSHTLWTSGEALYYILRIEDFQGTNFNIELTKYAFIIKSATYFTLFWELTFAFSIWWSKNLRNIYVLGGIAIHLGILILMRIDNFSYVMLSIYPILFLDSEYRQIFKKIKSMIPTKILLKLK